MSKKGIGPAGEPVAWTAGFQTLVMAALSLNAAFGWIQFNDNQQAAILGFVAVLTAFIGSLLRRSVEPV